MVIVKEIWIMENRNEKDENRNGNVVLLTIIGIATLLVALVGATFAYFSATLGKNEQESVIVKTANPVGLNYAGNTLSILNAIPGDSDDDTFTVENPDASTVKQKYDLVLVVDENTLTSEVNAKQLLITIDGSVQTAGKEVDGTAATTTMDKSKYTNAFDLTDGTAVEGNTQAIGASAKGKEFTVVEGQEIAIGETHKYSITVSFEELNKEQNENKDKDFVAHIEIRNAKAM